MMARAVAARNSIDGLARQLEAMQAYPPAAEIAGAVADGLLERATDRVRLERKGALLGNRVFVRFVGEQKGLGD